MSETGRTKRVIHFTSTGASGTCGATVRTTTGELILTFDERDTDIDCALCRMYVKGLHVGRAGA